MKVEYIFIKQHDDFCSDGEQFVNLLASNSRVSMAGNEITVGQKKVNYTLDHEYIENSNEDMFYMTLQSDAEDQVAALETVDSVIRRVNDTYDVFQINTIVDEVSINYAIKLYPEIAKLENQLRKIIYLFMTKSVGSKWIQKNIPKEMKKSVEDTMKKNQLEDLKEDYLYNADFIVLGWFFFSKYSLNGDYQRLISELREEENLTPEKIVGLLEIYEKKSNWERYFSNKIQVENLSGKWEELYQYRNQVAHSKRICKSEYDKACELIQELKQAFDDCIAHINTVVMTEEQSEAVEQVAQEAIVASVTPNIQVGNFIINESLRMNDLRIDLVDEGKKWIQGYLQENGDLVVSDIKKPIIGNTSILASGLKIGDENSKYSTIGSNDILRTTAKTSPLTCVGADLTLATSVKSSLGIGDSDINSMSVSYATTQKKD